MVVRDLDEQAARTDRPRPLLSFFPAAHDTESQEASTLALGRGLPLPLLFPLRFMRLLLLPFALPLVLLLARLFAVRAATGVGLLHWSRRVLLDVVWKLSSNISLLRSPARS